MSRPTARDRMLEILRKGKAKLEVFKGAVRRALHEALYNEEVKVSRAGYYSLVKEKDNGSKASEATSRSEHEDAGAGPESPPQVAGQDAVPVDAGGTNGDRGPAERDEGLPVPAVGLPGGSNLAERIGGRLAGSADGPPHLIVEAMAGTGKTTTLVEGLKVVKGLPTKFTPSKQQAAVWESMKLSKDEARSVGFCAFNKSIATELQNKVPPGCDAMTLHSLGYKAVRRAFPSVSVNNYRTQDLISEILEEDVRDLRQDKPVLLSATDNLVRLCKMNLIPLDVEDERDAAHVERLLDELVDYYDINLDDDSEGLSADKEAKSWKEEVYELVPQVLARSRDVSRGNCVDFSDMIWLPVALALPVQPYDLLLVDEAQDLNRCQQALARMSGRRLVLCGDANQAIYGFAGADCDSLPRMGRELGDTKRGCIALPLTVTRRCGKAIVREAQKIVPAFDYFESNPEGAVTEDRYLLTRDGRRLGWEQTYAPRVQPGDLVVCRVNAYPVRDCLAFLSRGIRAQVIGRDIGAGITSLIRRLCGKNNLDSTNVVTLTGLVSDWASAEINKENAKRNPSEIKIMSVSDKAECVSVFSQGCNTAADVIRRVESVFTDDRSGPFVRFSSVHKAKGLEAERCFILQPKGAGMPHPMAKQDWAIKQEMNILYVAQTRAREELVYVR